MECVRIIALRKGRRVLNTEVDTEVRQVIFQQKRKRKRFDEKYLCQYETEAFKIRIKDIPNKYEMHFLCTGTIYQEIRRGEKEDYLFLTRKQWERLRYHPEILETVEMSRHQWRKFMDQVKNRVPKKRAKEKKPESESERSSEMSEQSTHYSEEEEDE